MFLPEPPLFCGTSEGRILGSHILGSRLRSVQYARCAAHNAYGSQRPGDAAWETGAEGEAPVNSREDSQLEISGVSAHVERLALDHDLRNLVSEGI